eukprot:Amastigsp_a175007_145.p3 type:complete len:192 gc:universal Amastigsp_a175007_145:730-1305(+)
MDRAVCDVILSHGEPGLGLGAQEQLNMTIVVHNLCRRQPRRNFARRHCCRNSQQHEARSFAVAQVSVRYGRYRLRPLVRARLAITRSLRRAGPLGVARVGGSPALALTPFCRFRTTAAAAAAAGWCSLTTLGLLFFVLRVLAVLRMLVFALLLVRVRVRVLVLAALLLLGLRLLVFLACHDSQRDQASGEN